MKEHTFNAVVRESDLQRIRAAEPGCLQAGYADERPAEDVVRLSLDSFERLVGGGRPCAFVNGDAAEDCVRAPSASRWRYVVCTSDDGVTVSRSDGLVTEEAERVFVIPSRERAYDCADGYLMGPDFAEKSVCVIGLGSFGADVIAHLAAGGVGRFELWDGDRIEPSNCNRHRAGLSDVGRLKTLFCRDLILNKNPNAEIICHSRNVSGGRDEELEETVRRTDIVITCSDSRASRLAVNEVVVRARKPTLYSRAMSRLEGGEIFRYRSDGACYGCFNRNAPFGSERDALDSIAIARREGRIPAYTEIRDAGRPVIAGISALIAPITAMTANLALMELGKDVNETYRKMADEYGRYDWFLYVNHRERLFGEFRPFYDAAEGMTVSRWYAASVGRDTNCLICGQTDGLDFGEVSFDFSGLRNDLQSP